MRERRTLFAFERVTVERDGRRVLGPVTSTIPEGGVTVLVGPSGSGKSTMLRLCNRLEVPSGGRVLFRERDVDSLDPLSLRRRVGMVFQLPTTFPGTVRENLLVAAPSADVERQHAALRSVELDPSFLDRDAGALSGGEAQRVCLARTMITEPEVLLMDEPTSSLDLGPRLALERQACALARGGVSVVWVTHDLEQVRRVGDWVLHVDAGRVAASGPAAAEPAGTAGGADER
ncbi:MAG: phosphate ABC transporter ATP-binding protein [Solirubrobacteraceae bacterium]